MRQERKQGSAAQRLFRAIVLAIGLGMVVLGPSQAIAQDRLAGLTALLRSSDFRVRVQAAFAIGRIADPRGRPALEAALGDEHPAVRAAIAMALARLGDSQALPALRARANDREPVVREQVAQAIRTLEALAPPAQPTDRWAQARAYLSIGTIENRSGSGASGLQRRFRELVFAAIGDLDGIVVRPEGDNGHFHQEAARRRIPGFRLDGNISRITRTGNSVRCEISFMVLSEPDLNLRMMLNGAATTDVPTGQISSEIETQQTLRALDAALRRALLRLSQAIDRQN